MWRLLALLFFVTPAAAQDVTAGQLFNAFLADATVTADCPTVIGASIGDPADRATWAPALDGMTSSPCIAAWGAVVAAIQPIPISVSVTSTLHTDLNGSYSISPQSLTNIQAIAIYIVVNSAFPNASPTQDWPDASGVIHTFPSTTEFQAFATQMANYVTALQLNQTLPSTPLAIP